MVSRVELHSDTFFRCMSHALTTENEEVMGLLMGDIREEQGIKISEIWAVCILTRSCKQKDRVEVSAEQLGSASTKAEELSEQLGKPTRIIGWYHSHPHITVLPSHVDVRTQNTYQFLDSGFIGLIFACFSNEDKTKVGSIDPESPKSKIFTMNSY
jgi:BRCA1/BRCA2-containing complex subunit 3